MITTMPTKKVLTAQDVEAIRELLPYDWRIQIGGTTKLTPRQVSDVFYLRTTNPVNNKKVWGAIKKILAQLNQDNELDELINKVENRIHTTNIGS